MNELNPDYLCIKEERRLLLANITFLAQVPCDVTIRTREEAIAHAEANPDHKIMVYFKDN